MIKYIDLVPILKNLYFDADEFLKPIKEVRIEYETEGCDCGCQYSLLFTPRLITPLISRDDARNGSEPGRPSPKAIWNGGLGYCLLGTSEQ